MTDQPTSERHTPETDAYANDVHEGQCLPTCDSFAHDEKCPVCFGEYLMADFARKLERERDDLLESLRRNTAWSDHDYKAVTAALNHALASRDAEHEAHSLTKLQLAAVESNTGERDGNWLDRWGSCKVCGGEIPHGHTDNCDIWKLEKDNRDLRAKLAAAEEKLNDEKHPWWHRAARQTGEQAP